MTPLELRQRLAAGGTAIGTLITSASPHYPKWVATMGFDFVFIDTEHIAIDRSDLCWMCQLYEALGLPPVVRIAAPDTYQACMAQDAGACGIIAPYVETPEQARRLVGAVKYRPLKGRRLDDILSGSGRLEGELEAYIGARNASSLVIVNIESRPALEALDEILAVPGIDVVLVGPHDLSCSLGIPERYDDPQFLGAVQEIFSRARTKGIAAGIHSWMGIEREAEFISMGANCIIHEADLITFRDNAAKDLARLRALAKLEGPAAARPQTDI